MINNEDDFHFYQIEVDISHLKNAVLETHGFVKSYIEDIEKLINGELELFIRIDWDIFIKIMFIYNTIDNEIINNCICNMYFIW